jgi:hypothetical protein
MIAIRSATATDIPLILQFIRGLASDERLLPEVEASEDRLRATLFPPGGRPAAECVLDWNEPAKAFYRSLGAIEISGWRICRLTGAALAKYA